MKWGKGVNERKERGEVEGKLMGLPFTWLCKSPITILSNGFSGQGQKLLSWEPESHRQWLTLDC